MDSLRCCFEALDGKKAVGVDLISKAKYGENLTTNLEELIGRMKRMAYCPGMVREVLIPKIGKGSATRSRGISNLEDKLVQKRTQDILESIYEPLFLNCSYGFRPKRNCYDAVKALMGYLFREEVEVVLDVDLANFFNKIGHQLVRDILSIKIKDKKFLRYISRMLKAGVLSEGEMKVSDEGVCKEAAVVLLLRTLLRTMLLTNGWKKRLYRLCEEE